MLLDPENEINKRCAGGMELEGRGKPEEAMKRFLQAWDLASNDAEKCIAAHYVARHQTNPEEKLRWDQVSLSFALLVPDPEIQELLPSLYLNIAKGFEDCQLIPQAAENYRLASASARFLPDDGYGAMIRSGISAGLVRIAEKTME